MNDSSALSIPDENPIKLNIGELVEQAMKAKALEKGTRVEILNLSTYNFPFLLEQSGAYDTDDLLGEWRRAKADGRSYKFHGRYELKTSGSRLKVSHQKLLQGRIGLSFSRYCASPCEMLTIFASRRAEFMALLRKKARLIAFGKDASINRFADAICLYLDGGKLVIKRICVHEDVVWLPTDRFIVYS